MTSILDPLVADHIARTMSELSTGREIPIDVFFDTYRRMKPILHPLLDSSQLDLNVLNYALLRLPDDIFTVTKILLVQSYEDIKTLGFDFTRWTPVTAQSRRRLTYINPAKNTLACLLSSESDIHDLINCLTAFQIERLKLKSLFHQNQTEFVSRPDPSRLNLTSDQWAQFQLILGSDWSSKLLATGFEPIMTVKMYGRTPPLYQNNCTAWMTNLINHSLVIGLKEAPVYFVSSNSHSLVNIIGGYINQRSNYIFDYISQANTTLYQQWFEVKKENNLTRVNDFLYYVADKFLHANPSFIEPKTAYEDRLGIKNINSTDAFQSHSQLIPLRSLALSQNLDTNLKISDLSLFSRSDAYIINIDYPLGQAAYYLLNEILNTFHKLLSVYIMGKAAILDGQVGDIQIPRMIYDEMTDNLYTFQNVFTKDHFLEAFISQIFPNQQAACVYGTFLENQPMVQHYLHAGINVIEMESGPYLRAVSEKFTLDGRDDGRNQTHDLTPVPLDIGIINYASDNPLNQNLAQEKISLRGVEPTYLASLAVLQKIIDTESHRLQTQDPVK